MRLNLGCGLDPKQEGRVNMDIRALPNVDVVHDCEVIPWPFPSLTFSDIIAWHVFEHLKPWLMLQIMDECWRVLKFGGRLKIGVPEAGSFGFSQDPTHVRTWNEATAHYFDPAYALYQRYQPQPWTIEVNTVYEKALPLGLIETNPATPNAGRRIILRKI